jgi:hypothetical protein
MSVQGVEKSSFQCREFDKVPPVTIKGGRDRAKIFDYPPGAVAAGQQYT